jgi:uncharacterized protein
MKKTAIIDSGFLYATLDKGDIHHSRVIQVLKTFGEKILLPVPVLVETGYLIQARLGHPTMRLFVQQIQRGPLRLVSVQKSDFSRIHELLTQYADLELDLVDASVTALAERLNIRRILTVDQRDFRTIRPNHCSYFEILP